MAPAEQCPVAFGIMSTAEINGKVLPAMAKVAGVGSRDKAKAQTYVAANADLAKGGLGEGMTYEELVASPQVEAVYFSLPTGLRNEWILRAIEAGKHIYSEKPMGGTVAELKRILEACEAKGLQWMDGTMWYHSERTRQLERVIASGELGAVRSVHAVMSFKAPSEEWLHGGNGRTDKTREPMGVLGDMGWYPMSAILWAFGWELPERVLVTSHTLNRAETVVAAHGVLFFSGGRVSTWECGATTSARSQFEVSLERGTLRVDDQVGGQGRTGNFDAYFKPFAGSTSYVRGDVNGKDEVVEVPASDHVERLVEDFTACVNGIKAGGKPEGDWPRRSLAVHRVLWACWESVQKGGAVVELAQA